MNEQDTGARPTRTPAPYEDYEEDLRDVLELPPPAWARRGVVSVLGVLAVCVGVSAFVRYPDTITVRLAIVSRQPAVPLVARTSARVVELRTTDGAHVESNEILALLEHTASPDAMGKLRRTLDALGPDLASPEALASHHPLPALSLGSLAPGYAVLGSAIAEASVLGRLDPYAGRRSATRGLMQTGATLIRQLEHELHVQDEMVGVHEGRLARTEKMVREGVASGSELEEARSGLVTARLAREAVQSRIVEARSTRGEVELRAASLVQEEQTRRRDIVRTVAEAYQRLEADWREWDRKHVLRAPSAGVVSLQDIWSQGQVVKEGQDVMFLVPLESGIVGRATAAQWNLGRVAPGQRVRVALDAYPIERWGLLEGRVEDLGRTPTGDGYLVRVGFPLGLTSLQGRTIGFRQGMAGRADIVTEDISLLGRLLYPLRSLLAKSEAHSTK